MNSQPAGLQQSIRFGEDFELDFSPRRLRRRDRVLKLERIPLEILILLVERRGEVVSREEIVARVWGNDVFLDTDNSIRGAIRKIRQVLKDDSETPRFIQTLTGRGYRFIAPIVSPEKENRADAPATQPSFREALGDDTENPQFVETVPRRGYRPIAPIERSEQLSPEAASEPVKGTRKRILFPGWGIGIAVASATLLIALGLVLWAYRLRVNPSPSALEVEPLTTLPGMEISPTFSPDGSQVAFGWDGENNGAGFDLYVKVIGTDKPLRLTNHPVPWLGAAWSPDGLSIAVNRLDFDNEKRGIFLVPALGGPERKVASTNNVVYPPAAAVSWSADGKQLAFIDRAATAAVNTSELFLLSLESFERTHVETGCAFSHDPAFSPTGGMLAYACAQDVGHIALMLHDLHAETSRQLVGSPLDFGGVAWSRDGERIIFSYLPATGFRGGDLWQIGLGSGASAERISSVHDAMSPAVSASGNRLAYVESTVNANVWRVDLDSTNPHSHILAASTREQYDPVVSPDGKKVAFVSNRSGPGEIWVCDSDGGNVRQLTSFDNSVTGTPNWSPDGRQIALDSRVGGDANVYVVDLEGGVPRKLETGTRMNSLPSWSRDGKWIYFASGPTDATLTIWRVAATGGRATQLTKTSSSMPVESSDGQYVYFVRTTANKIRLWRIRPDGSGEQMVDAIPPLRSNGYEWWLSGSGIYFWGYPNDKPEIDFLDFRRLQIRRIATPDKAPAPWVGGLSVSPDGKWLVYSRIDEWATDLMLAKRFR